MSRKRGGGSKYIHLVKVLCCKLPINGKQLPALPLEVRLRYEINLRGGKRVCYIYSTKMVNEHVPFASIISCVVTSFYLFMLIYVLFFIVKTHIKLSQAS